MSKKYTLFTFKGICINFLLELRFFILSHPLTSKQPPKVVQIHMTHPVYQPEFTKLSGFLWIIMLILDQILLLKSQTACYAKSKCSLSHMLLTPDVAWLGTWQVGRGVVSILKWVGTAFQLDRTNPYTRETFFYDFWPLYPYKMPTSEMDGPMWKSNMIY